MGQAISAGLAMGAAAVLTPAAATPNVSTESVAAYNGPTVYFPLQQENGSDPEVFRRDAAPYCGLIPASYTTLSKSAIHAA